MSSARNPLATNPFATLTENDAREEPGHNVVQTLMGRRAMDTRLRLLDALHTLSESQPDTPLAHLISRILRTAELDPRIATDREFLDAIQQAILGDLR